MIFSIKIHDFVHTLLGFDVTVYDEIVVKWYEMIQLGFPVIFDIL